MLVEDALGNIKRNTYDKLDNLIALLDVNGLGQSQRTMYGHDAEVYRRRLEAFGWQAVSIDGHDLNEIIGALDEALAVKDKPAVIVARTKKGKGVSFMEDKEGWHGKPVKKGEELERAQDGNILSRTTLSLFYATDFADQLENVILPALKAGFIVLADRYIYTLMARDMVRGMDIAWLKNLYGIALKPDAVFYLAIEPNDLVQRALAKTATLDYWESGMDLGLSRDLFDSFIEYQTLMRLAFRKLQKSYGFTIVDGNRPVDEVNAELRAKIEDVLVGK